LSCIPILYHNYFCFST